MMNNHYSETMINRKRLWEYDGNPELSSESEDDSVVDINQKIMPENTFRDYSDISFDIPPEILNSPPIKFEYHFPAPLFVKKNYDHEFSGSSFENVLVEQFPIEEAIKLNPERKINLVLDIDSTLIYSKDLSQIDEKHSKYISDDSHHIAITVEGHDYEMIFNVRGYLKEFLLRMKKICNFYICTLSKEPYAKEIIKIIQNKTGITIPEQNIIAVTEGIDNRNKKKSLSLFSKLENDENKLIIDDSVAVWRESDLNYLLPSKRYCSFNDPDINMYFYQIETKEGLRAQDSPTIISENDVVPVYYESDKTTNYQLKYLANFIERVFKLSMSRNCSIAYAAKTIRKRVFDGLVIDLTYYGEYGNVSLLSELVIYLGGKITRDSPDVTHFIISQSNVKQFRRPKKIEGKLIQFFSVNSKWLFDCYFNLKRMDEGLFEYKVVL